MNIPGLNPYPKDDMSVAKRIATWRLGRSTTLGCEVPTSFKPFGKRKSGPEGANLPVRSRAWGEGEG